MGTSTPREVAQRLRHKAKGIRSALGITGVGRSKRLLRGCTLTAYQLGVMQGLEDAARTLDSMALADDLLARIDEQVQTKEATDG